MGRLPSGVWMRCVAARTRRASLGGTQAVGRGGDVQDDHSERTLQSVATLGRLSIRSGIACRSCGFWGCGLEDRVPDAKTVWLYREQLTQAGVIETLFETFDGHLKDQGYLAMGGQIIDASIVAVPKQRNSRKENARIKAGETPECWQDKPAKRRQKDVEARSRSIGRSHYGYKNHVNVDRRHKLVRRCPGERRGDARSSKVLDDILDGDNTALGVWADSAYRSAEIEAALKKKGLRSRIHRKSRRNKPLSEREKQGN